MSCESFRAFLPRAVVGMMMLPIAAMLALPKIANAAESGSSFSVQRYRVEGSNPLSTERTISVLAPHTGQLSGLDDLVAATRSLEDALRGEGFLFYRVLLPPQTIDSDTVEIRVQPLTIGNVEVAGNTHYSADSVRSLLPQLNSGPAPNMEAMARSLAIANENPTRKISVNLKEGAAAELIDAEIAVEDRQPWILFANLSNTGTDDSGKSRLALGAQHHNLFGGDRSLSLAYTTSPEGFDDVKQVGVNVRAALPNLGGVLSAHYAYSDVDSGSIQGVFDVSGAGEFFGVSYSQYFWQAGAFRHQLGLSIEDRNFENDVRFLNTPIGNDVRSRPITARYQGEYRDPSLSSGWTLSYIQNLASGSNNDDDSYGRARTGAKDDWNALRYGAWFAVPTPLNTQLRAYFEGQYAGEPLIPGEQIGVGGASSVRAFEERSVTGDSGERLGVELWSPTLWESTRVLVFIEAAHVKREDPQPEEFHDDTIVGAGLGLRWTFRDTASLSLDYGEAITDTEAPNAGQRKVHLNLLVRY